MLRKHYFDIINLLILLVATIFLLVVCNADVLHTAQSRSLCINESTIFLQQVMHSPDGLLAWTGCWLTQLFYYPWLGALVLYLLWCGIYVTLCRALAIPGQWRFLLLIPLFALLVSLIDLGYWIYYLKHPGYWFRETLGLLFVSLLLWLQPQQQGCGTLFAKLRVWTAPALAALTYPLVGWYAVLALTALAIRSFVARHWAAGGFSLLLGLLVPPLFIRLYTTSLFSHAWMVGFPLIESNQNLSWVLTLPFITMVVSILVLAGWRRWATLQKSLVYVHASAMLALLLGAFTCNFSDHNYHTELEMYRDMEEFRWDRLIVRMHQLPEGPTRQMVMCKNLALINLKHLGDGMFQYPNIGPDPNVKHGLEMHIAQTTAPMFYLQHGLTNDAIHWSIENSVEYGFTMNDLRIMTLAAIIGGETRLATKYINMLNHTLFGSTWAKRYFPLTVHPEWIKDYPELRTIKELHDNDIEYFVGDQGDCEFRIYRHFANTLYNPSKFFQEVSLAYSLMIKDVNIAKIQLETYLGYHQGEPLPKHYNEAITLFNQLSQGTLSKEEVDGMIEKIHGKTYKWFFFNVNNAKTY